MSVLAVVLRGCLVGVPLGYVMQRTRLCFNSAYREVVLHHRTVLPRAILLAVLIQMLILGVLVQFGIGGVRVNVVPFHWLAIIVGGFVFGLAIVYAEGCSSTVCTGLAMVIWALLLR